MQPSQVIPSITRVTVVDLPDCGRSWAAPTAIAPASSTANAPNSPRVVSIRSGPSGRQCNLVSRACSILAARDADRAPGDRRVISCPGNLEVLQMRLTSPWPLVLIAAGSLLPTAAAAQQVVREEVEGIR